MTWHDSANTRASRPRRTVIFAFVAAVHAALFLMASHWVTRVVPPARGESMALLYFPPREVTTTAEGHTSPRPRAGGKHAGEIIQLPALPPPAADLERQTSPSAAQFPPAIDWLTQAEISAQQQARLGEAPPPRALDRRGAGGDLSGGLGPDRPKSPEFGWDHAHIHRVQALEGGGTLIWLNDRCFIVVSLPNLFPMCGFGKIPARGDLFDHLRDLPQAGGNPLNAAP
jgi:hypothetical protein